MADEVFRVGDLCHQVVNALRRRAHATTAEAVQSDTGLPDWAVTEGLKAALLAGQAYVVGTVNGHAFWGLTAVAVAADEKAAVAAIRVGDFSTTQQGG